MDSSNIYLRQFAQIYHKAVAVFVRLSAQKKSFQR